MLLLWFKMISHQKNDLVLVVDEQPQQHSEQWKLLSNSNGHNLTLGGLIQAHNLSRRSKLNNGSS